MTLFLTLWIAFWSPPSTSEVAAFQAKFPDYLTSEQAAGNLAVARAAGTTHGVPPEILLAIAWHESRFAPQTRTQETGGRVSCGPMTPEPKNACSPASLTLIGGYDNGAAHLRVWLDLCHGSWRCTLWSYAGGGAMARACAGGSRQSACRFAGEINNLAAWIARRAG